MGDAGQTGAIPTAALEVNLTRGGAKGIAEAMVFDTDEHARTWFTAWTRQVEACEQGSQPRTTRLARTPTSWIGRRDYGGSDQWAEVAAVTGHTVRLYLLGDPQGVVHPADQQALLAKLQAHR